MHKYILKYRSTFNPIGHHDKNGQLIEELAKPKSVNITDCRRHWDNFNHELYRKLIKAKNNE